MSFQTLITDALGLVDSLTTSLQVDVTRYPWEGPGASGIGSYGTPVTLKAIVEVKQRLLRRADGSVVMQEAAITIPREVVVNVKDLFDVDGVRRPVLSVSSLRKVSGTYYTEIALG